MKDAEEFWVGLKRQEGEFGGRAGVCRDHFPKGGTLSCIGSCVPLGLWGLMGLLDQSVQQTCTGVTVADVSVGSASCSSLSLGVILSVSAPLLPHL